ncbi:MAG: hypothetical protein KDJ14_01265 [Xanthomonadales bacterium]|nr:hypothetical protein [Xanthomonadales bacterium]
MTPEDWIASAGVAVVLLAFILNQRGVLSEHSPAFLWMNFVGAGVAAIAAWLLGVIPFVVLEGTWSLVAGWGLVGLVRRRGVAA